MSEGGVSEVGVGEGFGQWTKDVASVAAQFQSAQPFPMVVLDGFLDTALADELLAQFPSVEEMPRSRDYLFGAKHELSSVERSPAGARYRELLAAPETAAMLSQIWGEPVFLDPAFHGGGYHQGSDGSYLDLHVDFNVHPLHSSWSRTLNVLLYLNQDWPAAYGGELVVKSSPTGEERHVAPAFNRGVIMETSERTFHGYRKMSLPADVTRKSIAAYFYVERDPATLEARTTRWAPEGAGPVKRLAARAYGPAVSVKNRLFGSGTARNR